MEIGAHEVAAFLARMLGEGHGLAVRAEGALVHLPDQKMRIAVDTPEIQHNGMSIRVPIGVNHPSWGEPFAWDQAVGVAVDERHPVTQALDAWTHNVLPVFAAMAMPGGDLAARAAAFTVASAGRTADVYYGPLAIRDFGGLGEELKRAAAGRPPTMVVVEELFDGYALPERPLWVYTFCARMPDGPITEVTLLNGDSSDAFGHVADHLPWAGHGSLKSWALVVPRG
ncbi:DUF6348 family protein [Actinomadura sp. 21ATH]|uniref:DUF6348 family protein n=1 Tax=Actinomadura sp. 21ATH TaxID=1735444 RepID=UPI0035C06D06